MASVCDSITSLWGGVFNSKNLLSHNVGDQKSKIKVLAEGFPLKAVRTVGSTSLPGHLCFLGHLCCKHPPLLFLCHAMFFLSVCA